MAYLPGLMPKPLQRVTRLLKVPRFNIVIIPSVDAAP
jgi:hypothetical protein